MIAVIFNPTARGERARCFREHLTDLGSDVRCLPTTAAGEGAALAAEAIKQGVETVVAAGGDGTVNEVLNGLTQASGGLVRARLGVLPLGTVNVFAKELGIPVGMAAAWRVIRDGRERVVDLPVAEFATPTGPARRHFAQLAGAGLDARAISLVNWEHKKRFGPLAYVIAGARALRTRTAPVRVAADGWTAEGGLALFGNGRFYGGRLAFFPTARLDDGLLHVTVFPRVNWFVITRTFARLLASRLAGSRDVVLRQGAGFQLTSAEPMPLELEGDVVGTLPARLAVQPQALRVLAP